MPPDLDLRHLGIDYIGSFLEIRSIRIEQLPTALTIENDKMHELPGQRRFILDQSIYQGAHGVVESVFVEELDNSNSNSNSNNGNNSNNSNSSNSNKEVLFRKVPIDGNSLECEALFQYAAYYVLKKYGLKHSVARVRDIYRDPRVGNAAVFTMVPFFDIELLSDALENTDFSEHDIVSIIGQIALIIYILDEELDMNHRDLKTTNVLISAASAEVAPIKFKDMDITISGSLTVKLVDFGFACAGNGRRTLVNAGNFFPMSDPCPKTGRDLFQLLTTMYLCTRFQKLVDNSERLSSLFSKWLTIPNNDYISFLKTIGTQSIDWVYLMLSSDKFFAPSCCPRQILTDIDQLFPEVVSITCN